MPCLRANENENKNENENENNNENENENDRVGTGCASIDAALLGGVALGKGGVCCVSGGKGVGKSLVCFDYFPFIFLFFYFFYYYSFSNRVCFDVI